VEDAGERLRIAKAHVETAVAALLTPDPEALTKSAEALAAAIAEMSPPAGDIGASALPGVLDLRREVQKTAFLLERARRFYEGWGRILGALTAGYTPFGGAAAPAGVHRICLQG